VGAINLPAKSHHPPAESHSGLRGIPARLQSSIP
jgi:hypothetical protein